MLFARLSKNHWLWTFQGVDSWGVFIEGKPTESDPIESDIAERG